MDPRFTIKIAGPDDLDQLLELYREFHPNDPPLTKPQAREIWEQLSSYPGSAVLVGILEQEIVSTCTLMIVPNLTRGGLPYGVIENVVTTASQRRRGFGQAILKAAAEIAWEHDCYKVMLLTGSREPGTLKFYQEAGFEQSKTGFQIRRSKSA